MKKEWDYDVTIILKTPIALKKIISKNPFLKGREKETKYFYFTFLADNPSKELLNNIKDFESKDDKFIIKGKEIYVFCPGGYGTTKLNNNFFERKLKVGATTRNWNSINNMVDNALAL